MPNAEYALILMGSLPPPVPLTPRRTIKLKVARPKTKPLPQMPGKGARGSNGGQRPKKKAGNTKDGGANVDARSDDAAGAEQAGEGVGHNCRR